MTSATTKNGAPLIADFEGDEEKQKRLETVWLSGPVPADTTPSNVSRVVAELDSFPVPASVRIFIHWASQSASAGDGAKARWFDALFQWCFSKDKPDAAAPSDKKSEVLKSDHEEDDDAEFVRMFQPKTQTQQQQQQQQQQQEEEEPAELLQLNNKRFHILSRIINCSVMLCDQGVAFLNRYLKSTSQRYRRVYILTMCGSPSLSNDQLYDLHVTLPLELRKKVFLTVATKFRAFRIEFIERVLTNDAPLSQLVIEKHVTKASSEYLKANCIDQDSFVFSDWLLHGELYEEWIHKRIAKHELEKDPLALGQFFQAFLARSRLAQREDYERIARLLLKYRPYTLGRLAPVGSLAEKELHRLSSTHQLDVENFSQYSHGYLNSVFDEKYFISLPPQAQLEILRTHWIQPKDEGAQPHFRREALVFCGWIVQRATRRACGGRVLREAVDMACSVMATISRDDFAMFFASSASTNSEPKGLEKPEVSTFRIFAQTLGKFVKARRFSTSLGYKLLKSWKQLHHRLRPKLPPDLRLLGVEGESLALAAVKRWVGSLTRPFADVFGTCVSIQRNKVWVTSACPERKSAASLWTMMRDWIAEVVIDSQASFEQEMEKVAQSLSDTDGTDVREKHRVICFTQGLQQILATLHYHVVVSHQRGIEGFSVDRDVLARSMQTPLPLVDTAAIQLLQRVLQYCFDFSAGDPRWFSQKQRLKLATQALEQIQNRCVTPDMADRLVAVYKAQLQALQDTDVRFALTSINGGKQQVLIVVDQETLQSAIGLITTAAHDLLHAMVSRFRTDDSAGQRQRIRDCYQFWMQCKYPRALKLGLTNPTARDWSSILVTKRSDFRIKAFLGELATLPVFVQREQGQSLVASLLQHILLSKNLAKKLLRNIVRDCPFAIRTELVIPAVMGTIASPAVKASGFTVADAHRNASITGAATMEWRQQRTRSSGDAATRMERHVELLLHCQEERRAGALADALTFVSSRIKNETGLVRPRIYSHIISTIRESITMTLPHLDRRLFQTCSRLSYNDPSSVSEDDLDAAALLTAAKNMTAALHRMLHDDMSKSDTVAKGSFNTISTMVLNHILQGDLRTGEEWKAITRVWIEFAVQVKWDLCKRYQGAEGTRTFSIEFLPPAEHAHIERPSRHSDFIQHLAPWLAKETKMPADEIMRHGVQIFSEQLQRGSDVTNNMPLEEKVSLVVDSISAVKRVEAQTMASSSEARDNSTAVPQWLSSGFLETWEKDSDFFPRDSRSLLDHAVWVVKVLQQSWPLYASLHNILARAIRGLQHVDCPDYHVHHCAKLFEALRAVSLPSSLYLLRPLAVAVLQTTAKVYASILDWNAKVESGLVDTARRMAVALVTFLDLSRANVARRAATDDSLPLTQKMELDRLAEKNAAARKERTVVVSIHSRGQDIRFLLDLSPSAVHLDQVQEFIFQARSDLLLPFTSAPKAKFAGVFAYAPKNGAFGDERDMYNFRFKQDLLASATTTLRAKEMTALAKLDAADMDDPSISLPQKGQILARMLAAPSTSLQEHVALLEKFRARLCEDKNDTSASFLLEKTVLAAYSSDQKIWLLAYLLSPASVANSVPRDTVKVIQRLSKEFAADAVVNVLELLLSPRRRQSLSVTVHKMIIRLLATLQHEQAGLALLNEWRMFQRGQLHPDAVTELISSARCVLLGPGAESDPAVPPLWTVIEEAAAAGAGTGAALPTRASLALLQAWVTVSRRNLTDGNPLRAFSEVHNAIRTSTIKYNSEASAYQKQHSLSEEQSEAWRLFAPLVMGGDMVDVAKDYHRLTTLPRLVQVVRTLCTSSINAVSLAEPGSPAYRLARTLAIFATLRLLQLAAFDTQLPREELLSDVLPLARAMLFDSFNQNPIFHISTGDAQSATTIQADKDALLAATVVARQYVITIATRLTREAEKRVPQGANQPQQLADAIKAVATQDTLGKHLGSLYSDQVNQLLTLPLTQTAQRRQAFLLRQSLREGLHSFENSAAWLNELFDEPLQEQEQCLKLEASNSALFSK